VGLEQLIRPQSDIESLVLCVILTVSPQPISSSWDFYRSHQVYTDSWELVGLAIPAKLLDQISFSWNYQYLTRSEKREMTLIRITCFKHAYFCNGIHDLNQTCLVYRWGITVAMIRKQSLRVVQSGIVHGFLITQTFLWNGCTRRALTSVVQGAPDFWHW